MSELSLEEQIFMIHYFVLLDKEYLINIINKGSNPSRKNTVSELLDFCVNQYEHHEKNLERENSRLNVRKKSQKKEEEMDYFGEFDESIGGNHTLLTSLKNVDRFFEYPSKSKGNRSKHGSDKPSWKKSKKKMI